MKKPFNVIGRWGLILLVLNEIRGVLVVLSVLGVFGHGGKAALPLWPAGACASAPQFARGLACLGAGGATRPTPAAMAPAQPSGSNGAIIRPQ